MQFWELDKLAKESGTKKQISGADAQREIYEGLRENVPVYLISGELHPGYYNGAPQTLGFIQHMKVMEGWVRYAYHTTLQMIGGDTKRYLMSFADSLESTIQFLKGQSSIPVFPAGELIKFHRRAQLQLRRAATQGLDRKCKITIYPQGELLNVLEDDEGYLRLQVFPVYGDLAYWDKSKKYADGEIEKWIPENRQFGFEINRVQEADIYDIVVDPKNLLTANEELVASRMTAKPGVIPFGI